MWASSHYVIAHQTHKYNSNVLPIKQNFYHHKEKLCDSDKLLLNVCLLKTEIIIDNIK